MKTSQLIICSLFAALTAVCSYISIPLPFTPVPMNLALLPVFISGACVSSRAGLVSAAVYLFIGAIGLPVFHGGTGGLSILLGPTGGYIVGYLFCAYFSGKFSPVPGMSTGLLLCYTAGTLWYVFLTKTPVLSAIALCVVPFILGDILKITAALFITKRLRKIL